MKKIYILILLLGFFSCVISQNEEIESKIEKLRIKANTHFKLGEITQAKKTFTKILDSEESTSDDVINYALILQEIGQYEDANIWFKKFNELNPNDSRGIAFTNNPNAHIQLSIDNGNFTVKHLGINSPNEDFSAVFFEDKVLFASSRLKPTPVNKKWKENSLPFLDIYQADMAENFDLKNVKDFDEDLNQNYHDGPISFNKDQTVMYVTTDNYTGRSSEGVIKLKLFKRKLVDSVWSEKEPIAYNSDEYSIGHATITDDNKWMFFSSSIEGGLGSVDIYKARIYEDGTYGNPINLGASINTEGKEMFPIINKDVLYFSSNGKVGLGGLDVFAVRLINGNVIGKPLNIGAPINTNRDDFSLVIHENNMGGYFSSNRSGGFGSDDIYSFKIEKPLDLGKILKGLTVNNLGEIVPNATVKLFDNKYNLIETIESDDEGNYSFPVENDKKYQLVGSKEEFRDGMNSVSSYSEESIIYANIELKQSPLFWLNISTYDAENSQRLQNVSFQLKNKITGETSSHSISSEGFFIIDLLDIELNDLANFDITYSKEGYLTENFAYEYAYSQTGEYLINEGLKKAKIGDDLNNLFTINPIYFDLDKSNIRPDARIELDKIVKIMNENPNMVIELGSHTDCRASNKYNQTLSQRRAKSSANYIKSRIPNPENIYGKGYGETKLVNDCGCEENVKSNCSEAQHQMNRRTEFIIISL